MSRTVSREDFDRACEAIWTEMQYQDALPRRTDDEAKDVAGFLTLLRVYSSRTESQWADNPSEIQEDGQVQVPAALHGLRKIAAIATRAMIYCGVRCRALQGGPPDYFGTWHQASKPELPSGLK